MLALYVTFLDSEPRQQGQMVLRSCLKEKAEKETFVIINPGYVN